MTSRPWKERSTGPESTRTTAQQGQNAWGGQTVFPRRCRYVFLLADRLFGTWEPRLLYALVVQRTLLARTRASRGHALRPSRRFLHPKPTLVNLSRPTQGRPCFFAGFPPRRAALESLPRSLARRMTAAGNQRTGPRRVLPPRPPAVREPDSMLSGVEWLAARNLPVGLR